MSKKYEYMSPKGLRTLEETKKGIYIKTFFGDLQEYKMLLAPEKEHLSKREKMNYKERYGVECIYTGETAQELVDCFFRTILEA